MERQKLKKCVGDARNVSPGLVFYCSVCVLCLSVSVHVESVCVTAKLRGSNLLFSIISKHEKDAVCNFTQVEHLSVQNPCHFVNG